MNYLCTQRACLRVAMGRMQRCMLAPRTFRLANGASYACQLCTFKLQFWICTRHSRVSSKNSHSWHCEYSSLKVGVCKAFVYVSELADSQGLPGQHRSASRPSFQPVHVLNNLLNTCRDFAAAPGLLAPRVRPAAFGLRAAGQPLIQAGPL